MKNLTLLFSVLIFIAACAEPEEPLDGLSKNLPVVVNTNEAFTFSLRAENFITEETYNLSFPDQSALEFSTVLIVTDFAGRAADTSYFEIFNSNDSLLVRHNLRSNLNVTTVDTIKPVAIPNKLFFKADDFSGFIQLVLAISGE